MCNYVGGETCLSGCREATIHWEEAYADVMLQQGVEAWLAPIASGFASGSLRTSPATCFISVADTVWAVVGSLGSAQMGEARGVEGIVVGGAVAWCVPGLALLSWKPSLVSVAVAIAAAIPKPQVVLCASLGKRGATSAPSFKATAATVVATSSAAGAPSSAPSTGAKFRQQAHDCGKE